MSSLLSCPVVIGEDISGTHSSCPSSSPLLFPVCVSCHWVELAVCSVSLSLCLYPSVFHCTGCTHGQCVMVAGRRVSEMTLDCSAGLIRNQFRMHILSPSHPQLEHVPQTQPPQISAPLGWITICLHNMSAAVFGFTTLAKTGSGEWNGQSRSAFN